MPLIKPQELERWERDPGRNGVVISHFVVVLAYVAAWAGLLIWRKWKYRPLPEGTGLE